MDVLEGHLARPPCTIWYSWYQLTLKLHTYTYYRHAYRLMKPWPFSRLAPLFGLVAFAALASLVTDSECSPSKRPRCVRTWWNILEWRAKKLPGRRSREWTAGHKTRSHTLTQYSRMAKKKKKKRETGNMTLASFARRMQCLRRENCGNPVTARGKWKRVDEAIFPFPRATVVVNPGVIRVNAGGACSWYG